VPTGTTRDPDKVRRQAITRLLGLVVMLASILTALYATRY